MSTPTQPLSPNSSPSSQTTDLATLPPSGLKPASPDMIDLPPGKVLSEASALALARSRPVRWIVIAGPVGAGKTTLVTSLYDLFQWNKVPNYIFAGSSTLPAFEERCFWSRLDSGREEEDTQRTVYEPVPKFLHLGVASREEPKRHVDFLITDVSGEMFQRARDNTSECMELKFLHRASHLVLLLDSKRALRVDKKWAMAQEGRDILRSCLDSEVLSRDCVVWVLWSKFDYFIQAGDRPEDKEFRDRIDKTFREAFQHRIGNLKFGNIAVRPTKARQLGFGNGMTQLLDGWVNDSPIDAPMNLSPTLTGNRESERFEQRHFADNAES